MPKRLGWTLVGLYCLALALLVVFIFSPYASHMSGLLLMVASLPWSYVIDRLSGGSGFAIGIAVGVVLNATIAYWLGYGLGVMWRRA